MKNIPNTPGIYCILNICTGNQYIGSTATIMNRIASHFAKLKRGTHHNISLQQDYTNNPRLFEAKLLEECSIEKLAEREQFYIDSANSYYNIVKVAVRTSGYNHSEESKEKMSEAKKKLYKEGFEVWNKGITPSRKTREKISETLRGRFTGKDHPFSGCTHTEEAKELMVAASHRRLGTHHTGQKGRVFKLDRITKDVLNVYSSAPAAAETLNIKGKVTTAGNKIGESAKYNRNAYGFKWVFEKDLDQVKVDELLESLNNRSISSQAIDTSIEGSETT